MNQRILKTQVASHASELEGAVVKTIVCETDALAVVTQLLLLSLVLAPARPTRQCELFDHQRDQEVPGG